MTDVVYGHQNTILALEFTYNLPMPIVDAALRPYMQAALSQTRIFPKKKHQELIRQCYQLNNTPVV